MILENELSGALKFISGCLLNISLIPIIISGCAEKDRSVKNKTEDVITVYASKVLNDTRRRQIAR
jgi:hypothetical protein